MEYVNTSIEQTDTLLAAVRRAVDMPMRDARQLSPLVLAYIGDTVYDLYVRTALVLGCDATAHGLHVRAAGQVCARAQAAALHAIQPLLTEDECYIYKRGRNSHMGTVPRNAAIADYRAATGLEALVGYLYLTGQDARLTTLMHAALHLPKGEQNE